MRVTNERHLWQATTQRLGPLNAPRVLRARAAFRCLVLLSGRHDPLEFFGRRWRVRVQQRAIARHVTSGHGCRGTVVGLSVAPAG
eukprot:1696442-Rhodomonas_salina.2